MIDKLYSKIKYSKISTNSFLNKLTKNALLHNCNTICTCRPIINGAKKLAGYKTGENRKEVKTGLSSGGKCYGEF